MHSPVVGRRVLALAAIVGVVVGLALPAAAVAHPLGNFTINHYAALRVGPDAIALDIVVDFAEIPAFQERIRIDADGDGDVSDAEADAAREPACADLRPSLELRVDDVAIGLRLVAAGLSFPAGAGGVPTMRLVCELAATLPAVLAETVVVSFSDGSAAERIGWREIVVIGDGTIVAGLPDTPAPTATDVSARLTSYPDSLLSQPLDVRSVAFSVTAGGPRAAAFRAPDAVALAGPPSSVPTTSGSPAGGGAGGPVASASAAIDDQASIPGGVGDEIPALFRATDLTPLVALGSILLAMVLGAGHALTPGHGKTLMAAYLVGTRGTLRHAAGLGLAVTVSHTLGILLLALLVTGAESALPPDLVVRTVPVVAAGAFVAVGAWMVATELRRRRRTALADRSPHDHDDGHAEMHGAALGHGHAHGHPHGHPHDSEPGRGHGTVPGTGSRIASPIGSSVASTVHSHGGIRHSHAPAGDRPISWRSLFALGLAGGIIPSTNALIILLGTIVAGRAAFGIVLVVAFGLGMAVVLGGVGVVMVLARERLERLPTTSRFGPVAAQAPLAASIAVLGIGIWLTVQAVGGGTVL